MYEQPYYIEDYKEFEKINQTEQKGYFFHGSKLYFRFGKTNKGR